MGLTLPTHEEERELLSVLCHLRDPRPEDFCAFLAFYKTKICSKEELDFSLTIVPSVIDSHQLIREASASIRLKMALGKTKREIEKELYPNVNEGDRHQYTRMMVQLTFLVDCASSDNFSKSFKRLNNEAFPTRWLDEKTFPEFFHLAFPRDTPLQVSDVGKTLKAWKLQNRYQIKIVPTNDLAQHLVYNKKAGTLSVFHQIAYLKAHIEHSSSLALSTPIEESLKCGSLAPQLLIETLYTIHYILFPLHDRKSARLLRRLVNSNNNKRLREFFDPNLTSYDGLIRPASDLGGFELIYWAKRVRALHEIVANPPPTRKVISWVERHTSERNALTVAILGLFLAALFGLLGLLVGIAQLVVSILAWKYPSSG